ncbi:hypothetical protein E2N92_12760 [Methanofollis formosanus]|uniref:Uncharacterized protein n=1 Tax=Methanofollis formosanus TaxID=299308 RepID=A0A8G1A4F0_9EURY|nr:hypothetical protein [Methanofollis formosanus]QYZ80238.1 hypothetical protein E2N92_12760 [Methanofollis formosanus]
MGREHASSIRDENFSSLALSFQDRRIGGDLNPSPPLGYLLARRQERSCDEGGTPDRSEGGFVLRISDMREIGVFEFSSITPELNVWIIFMVKPPLFITSTHP